MAERNTKRAQKAGERMATVAEARSNTTIIDMTHIAYRNPEARTDHLSPWARKQMGLDPFPKLVALNHGG